MSPSRDIPSVGVTLEPGEMFAGYQILRKLGAGGMGAVYQARDRDLPRFVALKLLTLPGGEQAHRARFQREADTVARLQHPNIVTVYARGEEDDRLWISMTFVDGSDVARALRDGPLHPARAVRIIAETAAALDHAHATGILHRDVKPANILLADGRPERVLLTDFGIAKSLDESRQLTQNGEILASFQYAAPERLTRPAEADRRADVYSLGCTLFHMLTGEAPYPGQNVGQIVYGHAYEPVPVPSDRNPTLPRGFDELIARAMAKDPERRFPTCTHLAWSASRILRQNTTPHTGLSTSVHRRGPRSLVTQPGHNATTMPPAPLPARPTWPPPTRRDTEPGAARQTTGPAPTLPATGPAPTRHATGPAPTRWVTGTAPTRQNTGPAPTLRNTGPAPTRLVTGPMPAEQHEAIGIGARTGSDIGTGSDTGTGTGVGTTNPGKRGTVARIVVAFALVVIVAGLGYLVVHTGNHQPSLKSDASTSQSPTTTPAISTTDTSVTDTPTVTTDKPIVTTPTAQPAKTIPVPNVVGMAITQAKARLEKDGFTVKTVQREDKRDKGTVVELAPSAGTEQPAGATITVYVASGPTTITVPTLNGLSPDAVAAALKAAGWSGSVKQIYAAVTDSAKIGKVIDQNPTAGTAVAPDLTITITVGANTTSTSPTTTPQKTTPPSTTTTPTTIGSAY
ncbi:protein kinase domain-containing protein [Nocardia tengchongensis]|uniref:protein kinase domain-containing protein n=1 Tax=Nocardia tengchongensis TaxID=2055889 RepID=UPI0036B0DDCA